MWKFAKISLILVIFASGFFSYSQTSIEALLEKYNSGEVSYVSVEELRMRQMGNEVLILDSRTRKEFEVSHLKNSVFIGVNKDQVSVLDSISKFRPIVVYCSLGIRSEKTALWLRKLGFENVENLFGGIFHWKNKDYPVVDAEGNETEKVHAYSQEWAEWLHNAEIKY